MSHVIELQESCWSEFIGAYRWTRIPHSPRLRLSDVQFAAVSTCVLGNLPADANSRPSVVRHTQDPEGSPWPPERALDPHFSSCRTAADLRRAVGLAVPADLVGGDFSIQQVESSLAALAALADCLEGERNARVTWRELRREETS